MSLKNQLALAPSRSESLFFVHPVARGVSSAYIYYGKLMPKVEAPETETLVELAVV